MHKQDLAESCYCPCPVSPGNALHGSCQPAPAFNGALWPRPAPPPHPTAHVFSLPKAVGEESCQSPVPSLLWGDPWGDLCLGGGKEMGNEQVQSLLLPFPRTSSSSS